MDIEIDQHTIWIVIPILCLMVYGIVRNRGLKGAAFGTPLREQVADIGLSRGRLSQTQLKIHVLDPREPSEGPHVGIEVIRKSVMSWEMSPISLTRSEARVLARELSLAADASEADPPSR